MLNQGNQVNSWRNMGWHLQIFEMLPAVLFNVRGSCPRLESLNRLLAILVEALVAKYTDVATLMDMDNELISGDSNGVY